MNNKKTTNIYRVVSFLFVLVASVLLSSCESSRVGPDVGKPNVGTPPEQPLVLNGNVVDSKTSGSVPGATVQILRQDGTLIVPLSADASGNFSYDVSTVNQAVLKVTATASGYGYSFVFAKVDLVNKATQNVTVPLDKIQATAVNLTPTGGTANIPNTESKTGQPVSIAVPAAAVSQNTTVQVSAVTVNNVPPPTNATNNAQAAVANLQPVGVTFSKPVVLSFSLPYQFKAGDLIPLVEFSNNNWQASTSNATVDAGGYIANVNISKTAQYALLDNTKVTGAISSSVVKVESNSSALKKVSQILTPRVYNFSGGTLNISLPASYVVTQTFSNVITTTPGDKWLWNTLAQRFGAALAGFAGAGTYPYTYKESVPWPGIPPNAADPATGAGNKDFPGNTGSWSVRVTVDNDTQSAGSVSVVNPYWTATITVTNNTYKITSKQWIWTGHNQGEIGYSF